MPLWKYWYWKLILMSWLLSSEWPSLTRVLRASRACCLVIEVEAKRGSMALGEPSLDFPLGLMVKSCPYLICPQAKATVWSILDLSCCFCNLLEYLSAFSVRDMVPLETHIRSF